ncbi:hypothetical protein P261_00471 [Lachnospiraceae bacterium TWA4]|nr:hypothetical protein P261_00471 [Lachnospiraceae bacterium TWA4]
MRKFYFFTLILVILFPTKIYANTLPCGIPIGIYLKTDGLLVVGTSELIDSNHQNKCPAKNCLKAGDYITGVNGEKLLKKKNSLTIYKKTKPKNCY